MFIAFEGGEATGKSTQIKLLSETLRARGYRVFATREPGGTFVGEMVRDLLVYKDYLDPLTELLLISAVRNEHTMLIHDKLQENYIVITDRFIDSSRVYQGELGGLNFFIVEGLIKLSTNGLIPDMTIVLDVDIEEQMRRLQQSITHNSVYDKQSKEFHIKIAKSFKTLASQSNQYTKYIVIDGNNDQKLVAKDIISQVLVSIQDMVEVTCA